MTTSGALIFDLILASVRIVLSKTRIPSLTSCPGIMLGRRISFTTSREFFLLPIHAKRMSLYSNRELLNSNPFTNVQDVVDKIIGHELTLADKLQHNDHLFVFEGFMVKNRATTEYQASVSDSKVHINTALENRNGIHIGNIDAHEFPVTEVETGSIEDADAKESYFVEIARIFSWIKYKLWRDKRIRCPKLSYNEP